MGEIPILGESSKVIELGKRPFFCTGCKGDVFLMSQAIRPWYRLEGGSVSFGGTSLGMGYVCVKCRKVMLMADAVKAISKELQATGEIKSNDGQRAGEPGGEQTTD